MKTNNILVIVIALLFAGLAFYCYSSAEKTIFEGTWTDAVSGSTMKISGNTMFIVSETQFGGSLLKMTSYSKFKITDEIKSGNTYSGKINTMANHNSWEEFGEFTLSGNTLVLSPSYTEEDATFAKTDIFPYTISCTDPYGVDGFKTTAVSNYQDWMQENDESGSVVYECTAQGWIISDL